MQQGLLSKADRDVIKQSRLYEAEKRTIEKYIDFVLMADAPVIMTPALAEHVKKRLGVYIWSDAFLLCLAVLFAGFIGAIVSFPNTTFGFSVTCVICILLSWHILDFLYLRRVARYIKIEQ